MSRPARQGAKRGVAAGLYLASTSRTIKATPEGVTFRALASNADARRAHSCPSFEQPGNQQREKAAGPVPWGEPHSQAASLLRRSTSRACGWRPIQLVALLRSAAPSDPVIPRAGFSPLPLHLHLSRTFHTFTRTAWSLLFFFALPALHLLVHFLSTSLYSIIFLSNLVSTSSYDFLRCLSRKGVPGYFVQSVKVQFRLAAPLRMGSEGAQFAKCGA